MATISDSNQINMSDVVEKVEKEQHKRNSQKAARVMSDFLKICKI